MIYFRRLPPILKLASLIGLIAPLLALALLLLHLLRSDIIAPWLDPARESLVVGGLILLGIACALPVSWYTARFRPAVAGRATRLDTPGSQLGAIALLAALPVVELVMAFVSPSGFPVLAVGLALDVLELALIVGAIAFVASRAGGATATNAGAAQPAEGQSVEGQSVEGQSNAGQPVAVAGPHDAQPEHAEGSGSNMGTNASDQQMPFRLGWWAFDLGKYRPCDGTYCYYPYESLPPIRDTTGTLDWLGPLDPQTDREMEVHRNAPEARGALAAIQADAARLGLTLPDSFVQLMGSPELQDRIPSCTACYFELSKAIAPYPGNQDGFIIRFLNDQQNVLTWYLYLTRDGANCVIVTPYWLEELTGVQGEDAPGTTMTATMGEGSDAVTWEYKSGPHYTPTADPQAIQQVIASTYVCGPSFVSFLYRWWLENDIWFKLNDSGGADKLTDDERRYLAHYEQQQGAGSQS